ncbi:MAG: type II secretion system F family protein [Planctomycetes bacterium]|nr:type II secretion system F family protein [Planctomycetota bacterium]
MTLVSDFVIRTGSGHDPHRPQSAPVGIDPAMQSSIRLSSKERLLLMEQLASLIDSGIQIANALQSMREQCQQPRIAAVLDALKRGVTAGMSLSSAMATLPRSFPATMTQVVRAGEASGALGDMLRRTVEAMENDAVLRGKLRSAMLYPAIMLGLMVAVVTFLLAFIVPRFEKLFRGRTLPGPTRILIAVGDFFTGNWPWLVAGVVAVVIAAVLFLRTSRGIRSLDQVLLRLPVIGSLYRTANMARSVQTLGLLTEAGVTLLVSLEHTQGVVSSPAHARLWQHVRQRVVNGSSLREAVRGHPLVEPTLEQVVAAGEATACLGPALLKTAARYGRELERRIRDLLTLVEPAMIVLMGGIVGFIALSIMLPIFRMSQT